MASKELQAAIEAAQAAAEVIRGFYRKSPAMRLKADASPVTEADVRAEEVIHASLRRHFPGYGFYGEETGQHEMGAESIWLVDPIDGTKSFVRETPYFSTQIALLRAGQLVVGVSNAPVYGELAWAEADRGAFLDGRPMHVSRVASLAEACVSTGNLKSLARGKQWGRFGAMISSVSRIRGYGDFAHYHMLARGALDVVIETDVNILDIGALTVIVREAGGTFTDLAGAPIGLETGSVLATNGAALHAQVLQALAL